MFKGWNSFSSFSSLFVQCMRDTFMLFQCGLVHILMAHIFDRNITCIPDLWAAWQRAYYIWSCSSPDFYINWGTYNARLRPKLVKQFPWYSCNKGKQDTKGFLVWYLTCNLLLISMHFSLQCSWLFLLQFCSPTRSQW